MRNKDFIVQNPFVTAYVILPIKTVLHVSNDGITDSFEDEWFLFLPSIIFLWQRPDLTIAGLSVYWITTETIYLVRGHVRFTQTLKLTECLILQYSVVILITYLHDRSSVDHSKVYCTKESF